MPYSKPARKYRKRTFRSRRRYARKNRMYRSMRAPLPNKLFAKMKYADRTISINPTAGLMATHSISANNLYDPDSTGTGHSPRGYDQLMSMYDHYTVVGAKITVHFLPQVASATNQNVVCGIALKDSSLSPADANEFLEGRNTTFRYIANNSSTISAPVRITKKCSVSKFLGIKSLLSSSLARGTLSSSPAEQAYFVIFADNVDNSTDPNPITCSVYIEYMVVFTEPKQPGQS